MRTTFNSVTIKIGTGKNKYPAGNYVTHALFAFGTVASFMINNVPTNTGFEQDKANCSIDMSCISGVNDGQTITFTFENPITINY